MTRRKQFTITMVVVLLIVLPIFAVAILSNRDSGPKVDPWHDQKELTHANQMGDTCSWLKRLADVPDEERIHRFAIGAGYDENKAIELVQEATTDYCPWYAK